MAANRLIDARIDALNPRTRGRALPAGALKPRDLVLLSAFGFVLFLASAFQLNDLCVRLFPIAVAVLILYPYTKRFTWFSHWIVGFADGMAPVGGWIAVSGEIEWGGVLLGLAVTAWVAGFDLIYACQDAAFDRREGLYSVPSRLGVRSALVLSSWMHVLTVVLLAAVGVLEGLGFPYWTGWLIACALLIYEHRLVTPDDLSKLDVAFFNMNGYIAIVIFIGTAGSVYFGT
jgi:4-hydroxybenzoate polyprenyltransferase